MGNKPSNTSKPGKGKSKDKTSQTTIEATIEARSRFKKHDLKILESLWSELEDDQTHSLDKSTFLKLFPLASGLLGERLYLQFDSSNDGRLDFNEFINGLGLYIKGEEGKRVEFLFNMFDYTHQGQLTRQGLRLMLHALIPVDHGNEKQGELDEFQFQRHHQSLHAGSVGSVESISTEFEAKEPQQGSNFANHPVTAIATTTSQSTTTTNDHNNTTDKAGNINLGDKVPRLDDLDESSTTSTFAVPQLSQNPSHHGHSSPYIDPRLLAEENRLAGLMEQLHDLSDTSDNNHFNVINEISIAAHISPEQERLTVEQLVEHAFLTIPFNRSEQEKDNRELDYFALEHFHQYVNRNPCILEHLENILDCVTWLQDPRTDEDRFRKPDEDSEAHDILLVETKPQNLCCASCGFSIRHCLYCGSGLTANVKKTFSICNNETTGLCGGWSTEGLFKFCLQCGLRMQGEALPVTLQASSAADGIVVVTAAPSNNASNGSPHPSNPNTHVTFNTQTNSVESPHYNLGSQPGPNALILPDLSTHNSQSHNHSIATSISQLSLDPQSSINTHHNNRPLSIPESPNHKAHTSQHGHHDHHLPAALVPQTRSNRTSSHHIPATPSRHPITSNPSSAYSQATNTPGGYNNNTSTTNLVRAPTGSNRFSELANSHSSHHHTTTHKQAVHYEGQVFVRSNGIFQHLRSRWLLCRGGFLYLFREREDREPLNVMFLEGTFVNPLDNDDNEDSANDKDLYGLEIKTKAHRHTFYMKQHDQRQTWLKILRQASKTQQIEDFYTFKKQVGKGKFATVYEASSRLNPDRRYAIKVISKLLMEKPEHLEQLRAEISIIKLSHHPNIIRLKEMFEDQHNIYLVMPLISGGDMFDRILAKKRFSEHTTRLIMWRLLSAIDYLHDREIVHSDIKPENVLLLDDDNDDNVILADFGLSSFFDPGCDGLHKQQGTISYLAPEVLRGEFYSKSIDIYALGVCAYLFLCGELPFQGFNSDEIIESTLKGDIVFGEGWEDVSLAARLFVQQLLSANPSRRPSAEQALLDPWFDPIRAEATATQLATTNQLRFKKTQSQHSMTSPYSSLPPDSVRSPFTTPEPNTANQHQFIASAPQEPVVASAQSSPVQQTSSLQPTPKPMVSSTRNATKTTPTLQQPVGVDIITKEAGEDLVLINTSPKIL